jgi:hypothetical protein
VKNPLLENALRHQSQLLNKLSRASASGQKERARRITRQFLRSYNARLVAVWEANRSLPSHRRISFDQMRELANRINSWIGSDEVAHLRTLPKSRGDFRPIVSFGIERRALQYLVHSALAAQANITERQYAHKGNGGRTEAISAVNRAINDGMKWALQGDIRNCFGSIEGTHLEAQLPLPHRVTQQVVRARHLTFDVNTERTPDVSPVNAADRGRRGIPQGSAVSSLVAEIALAEFARIPSGNVRVIFFADDFLILTKTKREACAIEHTLRSAARQSPFGPLSFKHLKVVQLAHGIDYLGWHFRLRRGQVEQKPAMTSLQKTNAKLAEKLTTAILSAEHWAVTRRYINQKAIDWRGWHLVDLWQELKLREIAILEATVTTASN